MRRSFVLLLAALLVCGLTASVLAAPKYGGIWRDALNANPPDLNPVHATDTTSAEVIYQIFESLVEIDNEGNIVPLLAESWTSNEDGTVFTFKLREGVRFHATTEGGKPTANGGREMTAEDVVWTFNHICDPAVNSERAYFVDMIKGYADYREGITDHLAGVKALDKYTVQFELSYPFAPFISILGYNSFMILPREDVEKWGHREFNFHPVGTGPFKFEEWVQDSKVVLSRNENYWMKDADGNQLPYLDGIEFRIIVDHNIEWTEFLAGNLYQVYVDDPYYEQAGGTKMTVNPETGLKTAVTNLGVFYERPQLGTYYYGMNVEKPPFNDKRVRQALNYAINREVLIDLVLNGRPSPAKGVLPPGMMAYNPDLAGYTYDPEKARQLMAEAGYGPNNPLEIDLYYNSSTLHERVAEAMQAQYAQIGVKLNLRVLDWGSLLDGVERGEYGMFRMGWVVDYPDPDNFLYVLLHSENIGPQGNYARFNNPRFDELTKLARLETDTAKRIQYYQEAERLVVEEAPWVFIYHYATFSMVAPFVRGYELPSFGQYANKFRAVWLDR